MAATQSFPTGATYKEALQHPSSTILDPVLRQAPVIQSDRLGLPMAYSGGKSVAFHVTVGQDEFALRCWTGDVGKARRRYSALQTFLKDRPLPCFVDFAYVDEGIFVNQREWPILRMDWDQGLRLDDFVNTHFGHAQILERAAQAFLDMVTTLHDHEISHGDLQHGNMLLTESGPAVSIRLVDYDSVYIPGLKGEHTEIAGLPAYQHPDRLASPSGVEAYAENDYFSELVIYLSFIALARDSTLWARSGYGQQGDGLLFNRRDFLDPDRSPMVRELLAMGGQVGRLAQKLSDFCKVKNYRDLEPLEDAVASASQRKIPAPASPKPAAPVKRSGLFVEAIQDKQTAQQPGPQGGQGPSPQRAPHPPNNPPRSGSQGDDLDSFLDSFGPVAIASFLAGLIYGAVWAFKAGAHWALIIGAGLLGMVLAGSLLTALFFTFLAPTSAWARKERYHLYGVRLITAIGFVGITAYQIHLGWPVMPAIAVVLVITGLSCLIGFLIGTLFD